MYILACSRRYPSTKKCRGNDVQLESEAVVEVQMKLRSHWQLLCQFKRQFMRQSVGQGDQQGRVYRAGLAVQKARMSSTDGCTVHSLAFDRPGAQAGQERSGRATGGQVRAHVGCAKPNLELRRPTWSPWRAVRRATWSPSCAWSAAWSAKLGPRGAQEARWRSVTPASSEAPDAHIV